PGNPNEVEDAVPAGWHPRCERGPRGGGQRRHPSSQTGGASAGEQRPQEGHRAFGDQAVQDVERCPVEPDEDGAGAGSAHGSSRTRNAVTSSTDNSST